MNLPETDTPAPSAPPAFAEPWQAQAFGMVLVLHEAGVFTWPEWAEALAAARRDPAVRDDGTDYFDHWLAALERLIADRGIADAAEIETLTQAWHRAARATPHGRPITLDADPEGATGRTRALLRPPST